MKLYEVRSMGSKSPAIKIEHFLLNTDAVFKDGIPTCECGGVVKPGQ